MLRIDDLGVGRLMISADAVDRLVAWDNDGDPIPGGVIVQLDHTCMSCGARPDWRVFFTANRCVNCGSAFLQPAVDAITLTVMRDPQ